MTEAVIFDMDGLIIDSEPIWREAEINVFKSMGLDLTEDMCRQTMGMRIDEVVIYWRSFFTWEEDNKQVETKIIFEVIRLIKSKGKALPGIIETIQKLHQSSIQLAIASSSHMKIINTVVDQLKIREYFNIIHSAEFEKYGKPHPQVFITTANLLKVSPNNCLVFEDSRHGMIAALAAKMKVIVIPEYPENNEDWYKMADYQLSSMKEFTSSMM